MAAEGGDNHQEHIDVQIRSKEYFAVWRIASGPNIPFQLSEEVISWLNGHIVSTAGGSGCGLSG